MDIADADLISNLPEVLLSLIISHLSVAESVRTSILSRKWKNIWKSSSCLHFDKKFLTKSCTDIYNRDEPFRRFYRKRLHDEISQATGLVERVIDSHETKLVTCSISHIQDDFKSGLLARLIKNLEEKKRIEELFLTCEELFVSDKLQCNLPAGIFFCRTLRVLELNGYWLKDASPFEGCRNLVTLSLKSVSTDDQTLTRVVFNCMFLEDLSICSCTGIKRMEIRDQNLKSLKLKDLELEGIDINAKCLSILVLDSVLCSLNMQINSPSLLEFGFSFDGGLAQKSTQIYSRIIDFLERCCGLLILNISIPPRSWGPSDWELPYPTFMFWEKRELYDSITHSLKVVGMKGFCGKEREIIFAKHLIRKAPMLRRFVIECDKNCSERGARETSALPLEPRASINLFIVLKPEQVGESVSCIACMYMELYSALIVFGALPPSLFSYALKSFVYAIKITIPEGLCLYGVLGLLRWSGIGIILARLVWLIHCNG
ncbi:unnamed protein product [Dovyalis caffra]|uniref:F-box domain-containing protein n=1 Tax=Dovyalis caffra TaxID=77055 RepID=A0AAV1SJM6_9ROSI|nr:unnamed protein product [Dovyalis caffra]